MKARVFDLGHGVGVCHLQGTDGAFVAEVVMDGLRVLPQSVRPVVAVTVADLVVDDDPSDQDHVDRMALAITRLRTRLAEFDDTTMSRCDPAELQAQARALVLEAGRLTGGQQ